MAPRKVNKCQLNEMRILISARKEIFIAGNYCWKGDCVNVLQNRRTVVKIEPLGRVAELVGFNPGRGGGDLSSYTGYPL